jgi:preprotein translocase subunit SecG
MNIILIFALFIVFAVVGFILWDKNKNKAKIEKVIVSFSEKVGDTIIEHEKQYIGIMNLKDDIFKIPALNHIMPNPPSNVLIATKGGSKKIYLIKMDSYRYAFRVPKLSNTIYVPKKDDYGNIILNKEKQPVLTKYRWNFCDDVLEPDIKHWDENIMEKLRQKHRTRSDMLGKWLGAAVVGMIFLAGIIVLHMVTKYAAEQLKETRTLSVETAEKVEENAGMLDNLIKKIDGKDAG